MEENLLLKVELIRDLETLPSVGRFEQNWRGQLFFQLLPTDVKIAEFDFSLNRLDCVNVDQTQQI